MTLIRQQIAIQRALAHGPRTGDDLRAHPPEGMTADDVGAALGVLAAAGHVVLDDQARWCIRGTVGMQATPEMTAAIESACRCAELSEDAIEATRRGDWKAAAKAQAALMLEGVVGIQAARALDAARRGKR